MKIPLSATKPIYAQHKTLDVHWWVIIKIGQLLVFNPNHKFNMPLQVLEAQSGAPGDTPVATLIILHGLGADGRDFMPIAEQLDLSGLGAVRFLFPSAPSMPVTINGGYVMPAWYDLLTADLVRREDEAGLRQSQVSIEALIAVEKARGMPASRIVVAGFSQGCAMALMVGLRQTEALGAIVGLSGYLPLADKLLVEHTAASLKTPVFMAHGSRDQVVTLARATDSRDALLALGYSVDWHTYPVEHSVCPQEVADLGVFLRRVLS